MAEDPQKSTQGFASVAAMLAHRVRESANVDAFYFPDANEAWRTMKWADVGERVRSIASGLKALGVKPEQRCAILCTTRIDWILCDLGILSAGAATTTIYPSNTPEECAFIINDSGTVLVIAEDDEQVEKLLQKREEMPQVQHVLTLDGTASDDGWVLRMEDVEVRGREYDANDPEDFDRVIDAIEPQHLATLIYTSGTTGTPKGVELLHDCWVYTGEALKQMDLFQEDEKQFLWLPMSHSFGKVLEVAIIAGPIPTAIDGRIPRIIDNLAIVRPTFMAAAPRIFEKVYNKVVTGAEDAGGAKLRIFRWALAVGKEVSAIQQKGGEPGPWLEFKRRIADRLVFSKLRERFGGRIRYFISGSAPLSRDMAEFFHAAGILICEGYGLTESSAASVVNRPDEFRFGTVGKGVGGTEIKIADDGEILLRSRGIMRGYYGLAEKTAETLTDDGWLLTGDIGEIDPDGFLKITDRKKDLIKTSGGKYVAPQALESKLKALCPYLGNVLVHGNTRNFCSALVTLDAESIPGWAEDNDLGGRPVAQLSKEPKVIALVQKAVDKLNAGLARYETIKKFAILEADWTIETGELTPSLKVKRKVIESRFGEVLDGFYTGTIKSV
ncbi:MAG TPA: long-chain fatty acid--CoA ligase [Myxococcota bacterium]|nr:long-chain fatty acid--CoA ligase [Myxococcota bacterium]